MRFVRPALLGFIYVVLLEPLGFAEQACVSLDPKAVEIAVQQRQESICPYQAIRVRITLRNISKSILNHDVVPENGTRCRIRRPNQDDFFQPLGSVLLRRDRTSATRPREFMNGRVPLFLEPGEKTSVSFAIAASWMSKDGKKLPVNKGEAIFTEPGVYWIKCEYLVDGLQHPYVEHSIPVKVRRPEGQDKAVYELLKNDQALASALMRDIDAPASEVVPRLKEIIERFPDSSYVPYARFALARAYMAGIGLNTTSRRVARAIIADELDAIIKHRYDPEKKLVLPDTFPFRPNALVVLSSIDPLEGEVARGYLHTQHPDSLEWLEEFAALLMAGDQRRRFQAELLVGEYPKGSSEEVMQFQNNVWRLFRKTKAAPGDRP